MLAVFLLDKALYELSYEQNNRPTWMRVPLMGILSLPLEAGERGVELDAISQPELDQIERMGRADLVIRIFDLEGSERLQQRPCDDAQALAELPRPLRTMVTVTMAPILQLCYRRD